jgi:hypothetical protein
MKVFSVTATRESRQSFPSALRVNQIKIMFWEIFIFWEIVWAAYQEYLFEQI